jgi:hypothetical protein
VAPASNKAEVLDFYLIPSGAPAGKGYRGNITNETAAMNNKEYVIRVTIGIGEGQSYGYYMKLSPGAYKSRGFTPDLNFSQGSEGDDYNASFAVTAQNGTTGKAYVVEVNWSNAAVLVDIPQ